MKQIFLDYTRKYKRGGGAKTTMLSKCECCAESQSERTKLIGRAKKPQDNTILMPQMRQHGR